MVVVVEPRVKSLPILHDEVRLLQMYVFVRTSESRFRYARLIKSYNEFGARLEQSRYSLDESFEDS